MNDKILELAKKLNALAERGIDGEKTAAIDMLNKYMIKHNITKEEIEGITVVEHEFFLEPENIRFFDQVAASVLGSKFRRGRFTYKTVRKKGLDRYYIYALDSDFIEIMAKYDFYIKDQKEQMKLYYDAYIQKNRLYSKPSGEDTEEKELTPEEKQRLYKLFNLMEAIDRKPFLKQLS